MGKLRRLERGAREDLASFILEDGRRYYYNPESGECFLHGCGCIRAGYEGEPFPEPPQTIKALTRARNKAAALDTACGGGGASLGLFPYERSPRRAWGARAPLSGSCSGSRPRAR
jgi:hypothetical protein